MYLGVLLLTFGWQVELPLVQGLAVWGGLLTIIFIKLHYEERLLRKHLPGWEDYAGRRKRLIPFLY